MAIDNYIITAILNNNILSMEYNAQQIFEHEIMTEMSASKTEAQKEGLQKLLENARVYLSVEGTSVLVDLVFLSVPKGFEEYADMLKANATTVIEVNLRDQLQESMTLDDSQKLIRDYMESYIKDHLQNLIGGM